MLRLNKYAIFVFVLLSITYAYFYQNPAWNGNSRLALTAALVREGRLTIDSFQDNESSGLKTGDKSFYNGHYYTDKPPGSSLIAAVFYLPMYWLSRILGRDLSIFTMKYLLTFFVMGLPSALAGSLIYVLCEHISGSKFRSFVVTMAIALGTMSFPFSISFFGHQLAASLLFFAFFLIFQLKVKPNSIKDLHLFLIGFILGLALLTDMTTAVIVFPLIFYYFYVIWKKQAVTRLSSTTAPALGGLIPMVILLIYNTLCFGKPFVNSYQYLSNPFFREAMSNGIMGIGRPRLSVLFYETFHPAQGLFWQSPVLLMALVGAFFMFRNKQYWIEGILSVFAFFAYLLLNSGYFMWWGGASFGPRLIVPMLPFLSLPLIFVPKRIFPLVVFLSIISVFQMFIVAASTILVPDDTFQKIARLKFFQYSAIYSYCLKQLNNGNYTWNLGQALFGLKKWVSLVPIAITILGASIFMALGSNHLDRSRQTQVGQFSP